MTRGERGQNTASYALLQTCLCSLETLTGIELIRARKREATATHRIRCWQEFEIKPSDQMIVNGKTIEIKAVLDPSEEGIEYEILGSSEVAM